MERGPKPATTRLAINVIEHVVVGFSRVSINSMTIFVVFSKLVRRRTQGSGKVWRTTMRNTHRNVLAAMVAVIGLLVVCAPMVAHHGSGISYDLTKPWMTKATIVDFKYINPHPLVLFDRVNEKGEVEHWHSEIITNPSNMIRNGWGKSRSEEALKPGTKVT